MVFQSKSLPAERVYYVLSGGEALLHTLMFTVYTVYFVRAAGLSPLQLVLVGTVLELTAFLCEVPTGIVADLYSRRLSVILGAICLGASFVLTGAVPVFTVILMAQVVSGIGYTFLSGATDAWLADEVGEDQVGGIYLRAGQIQRLTGLIGTGLSVALASLWLNLPYLAGGALYLLLGLFLIRFMPEHGFVPGPRQARNPWASMWDTLAEGVRVVRLSPILILLVLVELFTGAASEGFDRLGDAHLLVNFTFPSLGALQSVVWFGLLGAAGSLISLVVVEPLRRRMERVSQDLMATARALLGLQALAIASVLTFALTGYFWLAVVALLVKDVAESLSGPLFMTWLVKNIRPEVRATVLSMVSQSNALGQIAGGPGVGAIGDVSLRAALSISGLLLSPIMLLYAWALRGGPAEARSVDEVADAA